MKKRSRRLLKSLLQLAGALTLILSVRWALVEPYIIPSGSMLPQLLIYDHIFVNKTSFGIRVPFGDQFLKMWAKPNRGDIVVFRSIEDDKFLVKRVMGLPGDTIQMNEDGGLSINGEPPKLEKVAELPESLKASRADLPDTDRDQLMFTESVGEKAHVILQDERALRWAKDWTVPEGHYFMVGDNRDHSYDSRVWGFVPESHLIGKVARVWLSCNKTLPQAPFVCDPMTIRWPRLFHSVQ